MRKCCGRQARRRKGVRRKAERQDEPHQEALPKETGKQSPPPPE